MATTVGSHQQGAFTTPINGTTGDAAEVLANDNALRTKYDAHDNDPGIHIQSSALASRPAAGTTGRIWLVSDTSPAPRFFYDTGSGWSTIGTTAGSILAGSFAGAFTFSSTLTTVDVVSTTDNTYDLGASANRWRAIYAAGGLFGDSGGSIDASVALEVSSTTKALLVSRVADTTSIVNPVDGMIIYNNNVARFQGREAGAWVNFT